MLKGNAVHKRIVKSLLSLCILLCISSVASANAGVPIIFLAMPTLGLSILPIIIIEAMFLSKKLELTTSSAFKTTTISNPVSTIVGIPLTWLLLVLIQMLAGGGGAFGLDTTLGKVLSVTLQAAWLIPYETDLHCTAPMNWGSISAPAGWAQGRGAGQRHGGWRSWLKPKGKEAARGARWSANYSQIGASVGMPTR